jgi:hypothetical protein
MRLRRPVPVRPLAGEEYSICHEGNNHMVARTLGRLIASMSPRSDNYFILFNQD